MIIIVVMTESNRKNREEDMGPVMVAICETLDILQPSDHPTRKGNTFLLTYRSSRVTFVTMSDGTYRFSEGKKIEMW